MERILEYYKLPLDVQSLRKTADDLAQQNRDDTHVDPADLDDLDIDDEDFTIRALPDNTTRKFTSQSHRGRME